MHVLKLLASDSVLWQVIMIWMHMRVWRESPSLKVAFTAAYLQLVV